MNTQKWKFGSISPRYGKYQVMLLSYLVASTFFIMVIEAPALNSIDNEIFENMSYAEVISISPSSNDVIVGTYGFVKLYNYTTSKKYMTINLEASGAMVRHVEWSPDGSRFAIRGGYYFGGGGDFIRIYSKTGILIVEKAIEYSVVESNIDWSSDNSKILYGSKLNLNIWDIETDTITTYNHIAYDEEYRTNCIMAVGWSYDERLIAYVDRGHSVIIFNATDGEEIDRLDGYRGVISWKPNENTLYLISDFLTVGSHKQIRAWNPDNGSVITIQDTDELGLKTVSTLEWSPDGSRMILWAMSFEERIGYIVLDGDTNDLLYENYSIAGSSYKWSKDGDMFFAGSQDGSIHVWDADTGRYLRSLPKMKLSQWAFFYFSLGIIVVFIITIFLKKCFGTTPLLLGASLMLTGFLIEAGDTTLRKDMYLSFFIIGLLMFIWGMITFFTHSPQNNTKADTRSGPWLNPVGPGALLIFHALYIAYFLFFEVGDFLTQRSPLIIFEFYQWGAILFLMGLIGPVVILIHYQAHNSMTSLDKISALKRSWKIILAGVIVFVLMSSLFTNDKRAYAIILFLIAFLLIPFITSVIHHILVPNGAKVGSIINNQYFAIGLYLKMNMCIYLIWGALVYCATVFLPGT